MKKKITSLFLILTMTLLLVPKPAQAAFDKTHYAWKVSLYVGKTAQYDTKKPSLNTDFYRVGNAALIMTPKDVAWKDDIQLIPTTKADILMGVENTLNIFCVSPKAAPPPPPGIEGGSQKAVDDYFGDTNTIIYVFEQIAKGMNKTTEKLLKDYFPNKPSSQLLPYSNNKKATNTVPWVIVYEPMAINTLKDGRTVALTATEYALLAMNQIYNWGPAGENLKTLTNKTLPEAALLDTSLFGFDASGKPGDDRDWTEWRIITTGGWDIKVLPPTK